MRQKIFFIILLCLLTLTRSLAENIDEKYVMKPTKNGQLYFILPFEVPTSTPKCKPLSVDITYLSSNDSVVMNVSVLSANELKTDSIVIIGGIRILLSNFETFYIEKEGKLWHHRYSLHFLYCELSNLYASREPFLFRVYSGNQQIEYAFSMKKWEKERGWMKQILHIIDSNKRLYL